ncbi:putative transport and Golgi organization protein [Helianthus debilis subsp. tardiflorus]
MEFAEEVGNEADEYNGFNFIVADILSKNMVYVTNRLKGDSSYMTRVSPGVHVLSNASLDTPWPKMVDKLMGNTVKDDIRMLPGIRSPEIEYELSSVFVDTLLTERPYGTRSMSALAVKVTGEVFFYEKHLENGLWKEQSQTYTIEKNDECVN